MFESNESYNKTLIILLIKYSFKSSIRFVGIITITETFLKPTPTSSKDDSDSLLSFSLNNANHSYFLQKIKVDSMLFYNP